MSTAIIIAVFLAALGLIDFQCQRKGVSDSIRATIATMIGVLGVVAAIVNASDLNSVANFFTGEITRIDKVEQEIAKDYPPYIEKPVTIPIQNQDSQDFDYIEFTNKTNAKIYLAIVVYEFDSKSWVSHGWYHLEVGKSLKRGLPLNETGYAHPTFYYYAHRSDGVEWSDKQSFVVDPTNAFTIKNADKNSSMKKEYRIYQKFKKAVLNESRIFSTNLIYTKE
jgi:uncharacterized membrane protein